MEANAGEEWMIGGGPQRISDRSAEEVLSEAQRNIERFRKADAEILVTDAAGQPVKNCPFEVVQTRQEFLFGAPLYEPNRAFLDDAIDTLHFDNYTHLYKDIFNMGTALCYWNERGDPWVQKYQERTRIEPFLFSVDWARANGLAVKGHPVVWSVRKAVPDWLLRYPYETQLKFLEVRVRDLVGGFADKVGMWDMVNEMLWEPSWRHIPERRWPHIEPIEEILTYVEPALRWARDENPDAALVINEYGMEYDLRPDVPGALQRQRMVELVRALRERDAAPDAVGVQCHTGGAWYHPADVWAIFDELGQAGLPLQVTEFWAHREKTHADMLEDSFEAARAEYARTFYIMAFGHPRVSSVSYWGFMGDAFERRGESEMRPRPLYDALRRLIREEWMTRTTAATDGEGRLRFRGFHGDYSLRCRTPTGQVRGVPASLRTGYQTERVSLAR